jgi:hypothetical protein
MKNSTKKTNQPIPATLWLESLADFSEHAHEIDAKRVYLSIQNQAARGALLDSGDKFSILATARTAKTILQFAETVRGVSHVDAIVRREETEQVIAARMDEIAGELEKAGFTVQKGRWEL